MKTLIKNGTLIDSKYDILIENDKIIAIDKKINIKCDNVIDATNLYILPGLVDAHCHLREPGFEYKEDIESGATSAMNGGFTSIACMPNTNPVIDNEALIQYIKDRSKQINKTKVYPIGAVSVKQEGKKLVEMGLLKEKGAVAFSDDGKPILSSSFMKKSLLYAATHDALIISHCEDLDLCDNGVMNEGYMSSILGLNGISRVAEETMVFRDVSLAEYTKSKIHIAHISTRGSVDIIRNAKKRGVRVTAETCPHYFTITDKECDNFNTLAKVNPPLREDDDIVAIKEGLKDGTIDIIATDHAPHHKDEKNVEFQYALNGIVGFETAFCLSYTNLVKEKVLTLKELVEKLSLNPSRLLSIEGGKLVEGSIADLIIVDLDKQFTIDITKTKSKSKNSPYDGLSVFGELKHVFINGEKMI